MPFGASILNFITIRELPRSRYSCVPAQGRPMCDHASVWSFSSSLRARLAGLVAMVCATAVAAHGTGGSFNPTGSMAAGRHDAAAVLLGDGRILVAGGALSRMSELYDPGTGMFVPTGALNEVRSDSTAVRLDDGRVPADWRLGRLDRTGDHRALRTGDGTVHGHRPHGHREGSRGGHPARRRPRPDRRRARWIRGRGERRALRSGVQHIHADRQHVYSPGGLSQPADEWDRVGRRRHCTCRLRGRFHRPGGALRSRGWRVHLDRKPPNRAPRPPGDATGGWPRANHRWAGREWRARR